MYLSLPSTDSSAMASLLESLASDLAQARGRPQSARQDALPPRAGQRSVAAGDRADVRLCSDMLAAAADSLTEQLAGPLLSPGADPAVVLAKYATEHGHRPEGAPGR